MFFDYANIKLRSQLSTSVPGCLVCVCACQRVPSCDCLSISLSISLIAGWFCGVRTVCVPCHSVEVVALARWWGWGWWVLTARSFSCSRGGVHHVGYRARSIHGAPHLHSTTAPVCVCERFKQPPSSCLFTCMLEFCETDGGAAALEHCTIDQACVP